MNKKIVLILSLVFSLELTAKTFQSFSLPIYKKNETFTFKKGKRTLINFWASWCTSCIQEIPILEELKNKNPEVSFIAINAGDSKKKIKKFLKKTGFSYTVLMDKSKKVSKELGILSLPQTIVIDEAGNIIFHKSFPPKSL